MPTYEYYCEGCAHEFERFQKMSDDHVKVCPECGESKVVRRISKGGGILFKGPGFYATDYRKSPPPTGQGSEPGSEGGSSASGAGGAGQSKDGSKRGSKESKGGSKTSNGGSDE